MQSDVTAAGVTQADLGLVPVQPSPLDMLAYSELVPLLRQAQGFNAKLKIRFVVNQLSSRTTLGREVQESLADADIPLLSTMILDRQIYRRVVAQGLQSLLSLDLPVMKSSRSQRISFMPLPATKKTKSLGELLRRAKSEAPAKPRRVQFEQPSLHFTTVSLTPAATEMLARLMNLAAKQTRRKVSASSVIRLYYISLKNNGRRKK
jgi:hypothetical protein